jgi:outer membrane protein OmpA-like peptidoglycan-associated protein
LIPGVTALDDHNLNNPNALLRHKAAIESAAILFDSGSWDLNADQKPRLAELLEPMRSLIHGATASGTEIQIDLVGHSDNTGGERTNAPLSEARARKVMQELVDAGIDARHLRARGVGTAEPLRQEETVSDRQYNRSVTLRVNLDSAKQ